MRLTMRKRALLANTSNKQALIMLLAEYLVKADVDVEHAQGEADYKIVISACSSANRKPTVVVAEDSDVFQLMIYHADATDNSEHLYMNDKKTDCVHHDIEEKPWTHHSQNALPFLDAISGCDTTSKPYGIGKVTVLTKYASLKPYTSVFMATSSSRKDIEKAGEDAPLVIYGSSSSSLCAARVSKFQLKVATSAGYVHP